MKTPLRIGLTGGIGSGKSTACKIFGDLGVPVIDADTIAHELVKPHQPAFKKIIDAFGTDFLNQDGELDRKKLRTVIFNDATTKKVLESILHPFVFEEIEHRIASIKTPYCIICIPLLIETNAMDKVDRILVINIPKKLQISRASQRDNVTSSDVKKIFKTQVASEIRLTNADDVLHNDQDIEFLRAQINKLHKHYLELVEDRITSQEK